jgi:hypothetical protein
MRRFPMIALLLVVFACACDRDADPAGAGSASPSPPGTTSPTPSVPAGTPPSFDGDVSAEDLPLDELIPPGTQVSDRLLASTSAGDALVIMFTGHGGDPFRRAQGFVVWRRTEGATPPWRPVFGLTHPKTDGVITIQGITGDATGDGSDDALLFEATGGVGTCGRWRVIDLAAGSQRWHRDLCDTQVDISVEPPGLTMTETVYQAGDSHCCPSSIRISTWEYQPPSGDFVKTSEEETAL